MKPSNVVVPIIAHTSAVVPGNGVRSVRPESSGRRQSAPSRYSSGEIRENRLKATANASPRAVQVSIPKQAIPQSWSSA